MDRLSMTRARVIYALLVLLVGFVTAAIATNNGSSRPLKGHEIFVAQTATEMIERGDSLVPHYNNELRLHKPPLSYWLAVAFHKILGAEGSDRVTEIEARLPSLMSAILLLFVTFLLGTIAFKDRRVGLLATAILATSWSFMTFSRSARPEMLYTLFCSVQMLGLMIAVRHTQKGRSSMAGAILAWLAMAGALLAKGPQLPIFLLAGVSLALWYRMPRLKLREVFHPVIGIALVALVLPYFAYLATQSDGVFSFWSAQILQDRSVPLWLRPLRLYYFGAILMASVPWIVPLGLSVVHCWKRRHPNALVIASGILVSLFFLSFAGKLRQHYILPLLPLCAVLSAWASVELFDRARQDANARRLMKLLLVCQAAVIGCLLIGVALFSHVA
jgi:4-amino-4-deoxy-L-arabinose transferase-like glycosyltransferase